MPNILINTKFNLNKQLEYSNTLIILNPVSDRFHANDDTCSKRGNFKTILLRQLQLQQSNRNLIMFQIQLEYNYCQ